MKAEACQKLHPSGMAGDMAAAFLCLLGTWGHVMPWGKDVHIAQCIKLYRRLGQQQVLGPRDHLPIEEDFPAKSQRRSQQAAAHQQGDGAASMHR